MSFRCKIANLVEINLELLKEYGIKGIVLDLDNTIVSEDDRYVAPFAESWIRIAKFRGFKLFLLSNSKHRQRVNFWSQKLDIAAISPARKPLPWSLYRALTQMQLPAKQVVVIGDTWHTDILGAIILGCHHIQIASLPHPPQWWERLVGQWVQIPYPKYLEL